MSHSKIFRTFALALACALSMNVYAMADAPKTVNVVAGDLVDALESLAKQCNVDVIYPSNQLREFKTQGVAGVLETRAAFQKLVQGTSLIVKEEGGSVLIMVPTKPNITAKQHGGFAAPLRLAQSAASTGSGAGQSQSTEDQTQSGDKKPESPQAGGDAENQSLQLQEVLVTGSRISRPELAVATPTTVIGSDLIESRGVTNIIDIVNNFPQIGNGFNNANTSFSFGNVGLNQLNLRNLGVNRTLSLINGHRRVGTPDDANFLALDVSNIPAALIDRVEVQTGGSAAVYGADAVAGVVNFLLKDHFDGMQVQAQYGADQHGNYNNSLFGVTMGTDFSRGNVMFNITHSENGRLLRRDRGLDVGSGFVSNPDNTDPNDGIPSRIRERNLLSVFFGIPTITTFSDGLGGTVIFDPSLGDFRPFRAGNSPRGIIDGSFSLGPDGGRARFFDTRIAPLQRTSLFGKLNINLTDNIKFTNEIMASKSHALDQIGPVFDVFSTFVSLENPFMPDVVRQRIVAANVGKDPDDVETGISISRQHNEFGPRGADLERKYFTYTAGLEGELAAKYQWSLYAGWGKTQSSNTNLNDRLDAHWFNAIDSIVDPVSGQIVCRDPAARAAGCVPVNVFGVGTITPEALSYVEVLEHRTTQDTQQKLAQAAVSGPLWELPAGAMKFSLGAEYRKDELDFRPSDVWREATGFFASQFSPVKASTSVKEAYGELFVPLLRDAPFAKNLSVEGAYRRSDYDRAGGVNTSKLGLTWAPVTDLRFRVTKAITVRAPALAEMFDPGSRGAQGLNDPCDPLLLDTGTSSRRANCLALGLDPVNFDPNTRRVTTLVFSTGNPLLDPEKANTLTGGVVIEPRWVPNLSIVADWYDIDLDGGIARIGAQQTLDNCVDLPSIIGNEFCGFVTRDGTGNVAEVKDSYVNATGFRVKGVDFEISYSTNLNNWHAGDADWGSLKTRLVGSRQITNAFLDKNIATGVSTTFDFANEYDIPGWRAVLDLGYKRGPIGANWYTRWVGTTKADPTLTDPQEVYGALQDVPSMSYHDVSMSYDTPWKVKVMAGVNNLFDRGPRDHPFTYTGFLAVDDIIGRFAYLRMTANFGGKEE